jgi:hypothetical protein
MLIERIVISRLFVHVDAHLSTISTQNRTFLHNDPLLTTLPHFVNKNFQLILGVIPGLFTTPKNPQKAGLKALN